MRTTPHATSPEPSALALGVGQSIEAIAPSLSGSDFIPHSDTTFDVPPAALNLYHILKEEVELGVRVLERGTAEMAVTFFQSALQKLSVEQPFYDHLVHNLLQSYKLMIEQLLKTGDRSLAVAFLPAALRLEIRGAMAHDSTFLRKFAGEFQDLGIVFLQNGLDQPSLSCCRKATLFLPVRAPT